MSTESRNPLYENKAGILEYWRAVELFSPQQIPRLRAGREGQPVTRASPGLALPWQNPQFLRSAPEGKQWRFQLFCGIYNLRAVRHLLESKFGRDPEVFDRRDDGQSCLFSFCATSSGRPLFETFTLSTCPWALGQTITAGETSGNWLSGFESCARDVSIDFAQHLAILEGDEEGRELTEKGIQVGRPLVFDELASETRRIPERLGVARLLRPSEIRIRATLISEKNEFSRETHDFLNSFFIRDLEKVAGEVKKGNLGQALSRFLAAEDELDKSARVDVRRSMATLFDKTSPELFPQGRWPDDPEQPLYFSQQFAVNAAMEGLKDAAGMFAVNGPPGTGKTTLLRELIAEVVVERAKRLAALIRPQDAFTGTQRWKSGNFNRSVRLLRDDLRGFEIVVASSSNGAVENVTLEIPEAGAISEAGGEHVDYYADFGTRLLSKNREAWAMIAARLGSKKNRRDFRNRFWFAADEENRCDGNRAHAGFQEYLKRVRSRPGSWRKAVARFESALSAERELRTEHSKACAALKQIQDVEEAIARAKLDIGHLEQRKKAVSQELAQVQVRRREAHSEVEEAANRRKLHRVFEPHLLETIFTFGKAFREWRAKDKALAELASSVEERWRVLGATAEEARETLTAIESEMRSAETRLQDERRALTENQANLSKWRNRFARAFPKPAEWMADDRVRELSSPWADTQWNDARTQVFIEALHLHRVFIECNAEQIRKNLQAAMELMGGLLSSAPTDAVAAAWTTFFFVIPVVSTTFASFDRLFAHAGREELGWLLIDEAGQGVPQAAVGAMWRSRRAIVLGDPLQLEPVVTIPLSAQQALRRHFKVEELWVPQSASVQKLADRVSRYGTTVQLKSEPAPIWVGAPLRVHRRCDRPMFDISNRIAYDEQMVFATPARPELMLPPSAWIHVENVEARGHAIPAEGIALALLMNELVAGGFPAKGIFLISPFRDVAQQIENIVEGYAGSKTGTIHRAQGKESDVVILVLGGNPNAAGAKEWASEKPNLLNVAVSRAKRRLYIIGDRVEWRKYPYFSDAASLLDSSKQARGKSAGGAI